MTIRSVSLILLATATLALAQSERGTITGLVTDATDAAVPNAPVKVLNTATNSEIVVYASSSGEYSAANLAAGTYRIEVTQQGFRTAAVAKINLAAGATVRADVRLEVGGV